MILKPEKNSDNKKEILTQELQYLILYQREKLIKHIAKEKGWDEDELIKEFLFDENNLLQMGINDKKKSYQTYMDNNILDSDNDSLNSMILSQIELNSNTSSINSEELDKDSDNKLSEIKTENVIKKKRGRPKKKLDTGNADKVIEKKKRGRPKKKIDTEKQQQDKPKRKRGRPKKNIEQTIIKDPNIELEEQCDDDEDNIDSLNQIDTQIYQEKSQQIKEAIDNIFSSEDCDSKDSNIQLKINDYDIQSNDYDMQSNDCENESFDDSDIEYEEITCDKIEYKGQFYLRDRCKNNIYSIQDDNPFVGRYDEKKSIIDFNAIE